MPLGVQLKNEAKLKEMAQILLALNTYVPFQDEVQTVQIDGESISRPETKLSPCLIYGDQLTVARARGLLPFAVGMKQHSIVWKDMYQ